MLIKMGLFEALVREVNPSLLGLLRVNPFFILGDYRDKRVG